MSKMQARTGETIHLGVSLVCPSSYDHSKISDLRASFSVLGGAMKRNARNSSFSPYYEIQGLPCRMVNLVIIRFSLIKESICRVLSVCKTSLTSTKLVVSPLAKKGQLDIRLAAHWQESEISAVFKDRGRLLVYGQR